MQIFVVTENSCDSLVMTNPIVMTVYIHRIVVTYPLHSKPSVGGTFVVLR